MNKIWIIIKNEYKQSVLKKGFIISTILGPVIMLSLVFIPALLIKMEVEESVRLKIIDYSGFTYQVLTEKLDQKLSDGQDKYILDKLDIKPEDFLTQKEDLKTEVFDEKINGFILISKDVIDNGKVEFYAKNVSNLDLNRNLRQAIDEAVIEYKISRSGLDQNLINELTKHTEFKTIKIKKGMEEKERGFGEEYFGTFAFVMILYITILLYGNTIMRGIIQEKTSRVIEVLLSSTNPFQLMAGKILGLGSVGLTQYLIWSLFGIGILLYGSLFMPTSTDWFNFSPTIFMYFVLYFILGYFLFATLYAGVGAITNNEQEAQQLSMPIVFSLIIPLLMIGFLVKNPDSAVATILSLIPFFSPILMFTRINLSSPSFIEIWGSILILIATILFFIWIVARIYRIGILMYGKKPKLPEILKWISVK